jgi:esterase
MKVHSKIYGHGEPMIILHGLFGMLDNWKSIATHFSKNFEVHLIDQRNHGLSPHSRDFSYQHMSDDLLEYMDERRLGPAVLMGHSMGGKTAMTFATQNGEHVDRLIVVDIAPKYYPVHHREIINALLSVDLEQNRTRREVELLLEKSIPDFGVRQFLLKNLYWEEKDKLGWRFNLPVLNDLIENVGEALPEGSSFEGSALFMSGGRSNYITKDDHELIYEHFPRAEFVVIKKAGHWLHAEAPAEFIDAVEDYLSF